MAVTIEPPDAAQNGPGIQWDSPTIHGRSWGPQLGTRMVLQRNLGQLVAPLF